MAHNIRTCMSVLCALQREVYDVKYIVNNPYESEEVRRDAESRLEPIQQDIEVWLGYLRERLEHTPNINDIMVNGMDSALTYAIHHGILEAARLLVSYGADPDLQVGEDTARQLAINHGYSVFDESG